MAMIIFGAVAKIKFKMYHTCHMILQYTHYTCLLKLPKLREILGVVVPQEQHVVHRQPSVVDLGQQAHEGHALHPVALSRQGLGEHRERLGSDLPKTPKEEGENTHTHTTLLLLLLLLFVVCLTYTDPLRIQPWSTRWVEPRKLNENTRYK